MFDDDDDDSEPGFSAVDNYYFEEGNGDPVCFSVLPLRFDENGEVACLDSKKVDLQGFAHNGLLRVHTQVVAWRVGLNYEQPKILVLSSEGTWIELLKPRKCYEKTIRSILITVQMLHFVRKCPRKRKRSLWDHLCEVFSKFDTKPAEYDLKKHSSIIKLFAENDPTLMKSKILQMFTENTSRNIREAVRTKQPTVVSSSGDEEDLDNDSDDDYSGKEDNSDADYSCDDDDSDDQGNGDDKSNDDYSCNDDDSDIDNDGDDDGGTDNLCAICDNGGKLLSCEGQCKRAFHPREKDGIESNCETLGLTTAQLKETDHYLCKNCECKQHQCFSCGDLEPSDGPNAKVFQCYKASCGHFYHPSCIAKLLEPHDTDGACKLEKKIAAGMSFTCTVHWCSECGKMGDIAQEAQWLAVCRRCPVSYHKGCLPSTISFKKKRGGIVRAWQLDDRIIIYCGRHEIEDTTGTPCKDHIKFPSITEIDTIGSHGMDHTPSVAEIDRTRDLSKKKAKVTNTDQVSTGITEIPNKLCSKEANRTKKVAMNNSREHIFQNGRGVLKKDATHLNLVHNDEQDSIIVEEEAEGDKNNTKSGKEKETHTGENAYGHDLIFEKEKIPGKDDNNSVKTTTSNRIRDQRVDGSYAAKQELKNPRCNDNKATEIDNSGDISRMRQEHKEHATDGKVLNLDKNGEKLHMKTGRDACYKVQGSQGLHNHNEPDALAHKFRNRDLSSSSTSRSHPRHSDGDVGRNSMPSPASYPTRTEYGGRRRHGPPSYGGRHGPCKNSGGSQYVDYTMNRGTASFPHNPRNVERDSTGSYGGRFSDCGEGSGYRQRNRLNLEDGASAAGSVTDK
uniref:Uncharacterized protein n=1 Tax=Avena sativa TaxID=4498 RepID=A0ACD6A2X7_AVESA